MPRTSGQDRRESLRERRERRALIDDPEIVLNAAARFLEVRSRSVHELRRHLAQAGYRADLVQAAVARLTELGMLDDATFARTWVESRDRARPRSEAALRRELSLKGIDRELAVELLDERRAATSARAARAVRPKVVAAIPASRATAPTCSRPGGFWPSGAAPWRASPTRGSAGSGRTQCWPATASTPRFAATRRTGSSRLRRNRRLIPWPGRLTAGRLLIALGTPPGTATSGVAVARPNSCVRRRLRARRTMRRWPRPSRDVSSNHRQRGFHPMVLRERAQTGSGRPSQFRRTSGPVIGRTGGK